MDDVTPAGSVFNFSLDGRKYKLDVQADLMITPGTFETCLMTHTAKLAFYAGLYRTADRLVMKAQDEFDIWESTKRSLIRSSLLASGSKGVTEKSLDDAIKADIEYPARKSEIVEIIYVRDMLSSIVTAFRDRTSMLMKIGAKVRETNAVDDMAAGELTVKDRQFQESEFVKHNNNRRR